MSLLVAIPSSYAEGFEILARHGVIDTTLARDRALSTSGHELSGYAGRARR